MSHFEYEKPSAVEISERELNEIAAVLYSSGGGTVPATTYEDYIHISSGFAENSVGNTISQLADAINARFSSRTLAYRAWLFFRILGGFVYNDDSADGFGGIMWDSVAGPLSYSRYSAGSTVPTYEETYFVSTLGFSSERYRLLRYYVRLQHEFCNEADPQIDKKYKTYWNTFGKYFSEPDTVHIPDGSGRTVDNIDLFKWFLECNRTAMKGTADFAHMCIIAATQLAEAAGYSFNALHATLSTSYPGLSAMVSASGARKMLSGWLGDLSFSGKETGKVSMGRDDYFADIDALWIAKFCEGYNYSYENAIRDHYATISSETRRGFFLSSCASLDDVLTYTRCVSSDGSGMSNAQWLSFISSDKAYEDLYTFYLVLKGSKAEPVL